MSEAAFEKSNELRVLLLPLADGNLLLPNAVVVEVLRYPEVEKSAADMPDWYLGCFDWRSLSLPLVAWEHLSAKAVTADTVARKRVAVCHQFSGGDAGSFVGLEISGSPRLVSVTEADLQAGDSSADPVSCILGEVRLQGIVVRIPDLDALGKMLARLG